MTSTESLRRNAGGSGGAGLRVRRAVSADIGILRALADEIWRASYGAMLSSDQMDYMLARMYAPAVIADEMARGTVWEIVELDGAPIGYLALAGCRDGTADLHKLYVLPAHQGAGVGQRLLARAEAIARQHGSTCIRLRVNRTNARAMRSYGRAGFRRVGDDVANIGGGYVMDDHIFEKSLATSLIVKICGLSTPETIDVALEAGADWLGFVFFPKSPRHISLEAAAELASRVRGRAESVVLTVDADDRALDAIVETVRPNRLQLHGHENPDRVDAIRGRYDLPILKAIGVAREDDLGAAEPYRGIADTILFDAKPPQTSQLPGGNGVPFDWAILAQAPPPFLLSGGLAPANVAEAIRVSGAAGVDVSSGVERSPGIKDETLIRAFIQAARG